MHYSALKNRHVVCPKCHTTYRINMIQLTLSHGIVSCAECRTTFNAIQSLYDTQLVLQTKQPPKVAKNEIEEFFYQKISQSNVDLIDYLDGLDHRLYRENNLTYNLKYHRKNKYSKQMNFKLSILFLIVLIIWLIMIYYYR